VQAKGSIVRDLNYNFYSNIYTGGDITLNSSHLFNLFQIQEWCWAEEPFKLIWAVRTDGALLSCTFLKDEKIIAWTHHDTQGSFVSICTVTEPPVDAVYVATQRKIGANTAYMIERMDNRLWPTVDSCWCVDCGQSLPQPKPAAVLHIGATTGAISTLTVTQGGSGYSAATTITVTDDNGQGLGSGAVVAPVIVGGVITGLTGGGGTGYSNPQFTAVDPAGSEGGSGFAGTCLLSGACPLNASGNVFSPGDIGSVIRAAGGVATITGYSDPQNVTVNVTVPFTAVIPVNNDQVSITPPGAITPVDVNNWTMTAPVSMVSGLYYLAGASVVGVADGQKVGPLTVSDSRHGRPAASGVQHRAGPVLPAAASVDVPRHRHAADPAGRAQEGGRGDGAGPRLARLRGGVQPDRRLDLEPAAGEPDVDEHDGVPDLGVAPFGTTYVPLATGDVRVPLQGGFTTKGQVAVQQPDPFPLNVLSFITEEEPGDHAGAACAAAAGTC
jgi:hypothetical protein